MVFQVRGRKVCPILTRLSTLAQLPEMNMPRTIQYFQLRQFLRIALILLVASLAELSVADVLLMPTPDEGVQPRLVQDSDGGIHLLYFKKRINRPAAREGNLFYRQYDAASQRFGLPVKVSSQAFNMQTFSIARAAMAVGGDGRIHVMWYLPRESAFLYSRSNEARSSFSEQQSMALENVEGIDAGGDIAAYGDSVAIVWGAGDLTREDERSMYARFSLDAGASFGPEVMLANPDLGACACCSVALEYDSESLLYLAYRSAIEGVGRHMQVLAIENVESVDAGSSVVDYLPLQDLQRWEASFCPLSTNDFDLTAVEEQILVFETESRIVKLDLQEPSSIALVGEPFSETRQKNPAVSVNSRGELLVVWGEAISHSRGGRLNLRVFDSEGSPTGFTLPEEVQIGKYSFPAAASTVDGDFLVLY